MTLKCALAVTCVVVATTADSRTANSAEPRTPTPEPRTPNLELRTPNLEPRTRTGNREPGTGNLAEVEQANQPVYPAYDGFVRQPDGALVLSFAYFNHNADVVTIPSGETNGFGPAPGDRRQPTRFKPGHHRYQCVMVVGADFDGKIRWRVNYGGTTTSTSENMLQYSWELEDAAARQAMRAIDVAKAPRGVCLNRPPIVRVLGLVAGGQGADGIQRQGTRGLNATVGEVLRIFGSVEDEGLPRGAALAIEWKKISGPGTVTFADAAAARTRATFSTPGTYQLELAASDSERDARTTLTVFVR